MLDQVRWDYYGTETPIAQVAQVTTPEANLILVQPWEIFSCWGHRKGHPHLVGRVQPDARRQNHPRPGTPHDRRPPQGGHQALAGVLEDHKTSIRNIRRDGNDSVKKAAKDKLISADDEKRANEEIQALTDSEIKRVEELFKAKEKEVMTLVIPRDRSSRCGAGAALRDWFAVLRATSRARP